MDAPSLYDEDIYLWAEQQAAALRRAAASGQLSSNELDLEHLAEEIQDVGKSELHATTSLLSRALEHVAKLVADPHSNASVRWRGEVVRFLADAEKSYSPSMRRLIDMDDVWQTALRLAYVNLDAYGVEFVPDFPRTCPYLLDELLEREFDVGTAVARLRSLTKAG